MKHAGVPYLGTPAICLFFLIGIEQVGEATCNIVHFILFIRVIGNNHAFALSGRAQFRGSVFLSRVFVFDVGKPLLYIIVLSFRAGAARGRLYYTESCFTEKFHKR